MATEFIAFEVDGVTGIVTEREMTPKEIAEHEAMIANSQELISE
jgi:hypothetical protein